jgi:hypothetical protein
MAAPVSRSRFISTFNPAARFGEIAAGASLDLEALDLLPQVIGRLPSYWHHLPRTV